MPAKVVALPLNASAQIPRRGRRKKLPVEWLPQQHGAWAMLFLPFVVGAVLRMQEVGFRAFVVPLLLLWLVGYFAFHALSLWLKARNKARYVRPLQVYGGLTVLLGSVVLLLEPSLLGWGAVYAPLLGVGLWQAWKRDESALLGRFVTVLAACLICAVTFSDGLASFWHGLRAADAGHLRALAATAVLTGYFLGTVLYVKTMIRERGERQFWHLSVGFHALLLGFAIWAAALGGVGWPVPAFFALLTARAAALPYFGPLRGQTMTPKQVGLTEFALSFGLLLLLGYK